MIKTTTFIKRLQPTVVFIRHLSRYDSMKFSVIEDTYTSIPDDDDDNDDSVWIKRQFKTNYRFVDKANIEVRGGKGGNGCVSFESPKPSIKRPTGGNGGAGGNVYIVADRTMTSLALQVAHFNAKDGGNGSSDKLTGKRGEDLYIKVPLGTVITEKLSYNDMMEYAEKDMFGNVTEVVDVDPPSVDLDTHGTCILVAKGGRPGLGNGALAGGKKGMVYHSTTLHKTPGMLGEHKALLLELKLIADVGLVGFPNAGKSSLLKALSNARPKIAPYPFTTLHPNIGVISYSDKETISMADIPGLIEGAHENRGLGHDFLRHIERTKILLYVIDGASSEGRDPADDLKALVSELRQYDRKLMGKPSLIFLNKMDIEGNEELHEKFKKAARRAGISVMTGSAKTSKGIGELAEKLRVMLSEEDTDWYSSQKKH
mmetsp:Transcript_418/g.790  ORF Transcript_418/g.790 Transcript_418/m.790 type:complete len:428 (+) Transcript_418:94-1377(+)